MAPGCKDVPAPDNKPAPANPCPPGSHLDDDRRAAILALLRSIPEGAALLDRSTGSNAPPANTPAPLPITLCFAKHASSGLTPGHLALLDDDLSPPEAAARVGHLLLHHTEGLPFTDTPGDCHARVERAVIAEARAFDLELRLRHALAVTHPRLAPELETVYWRATPETRLSTIAQYLRDHPDGAPGMEAIVGGYLRRCQSGTPSP